MKNVVKAFGPNNEGRDFVIGDLHGSYDSFVNLLSNLNFDKSKDRMFSVGDLVDRGPKNLECLRLLREPWFHAITANHEQLMLAAFYGEALGNYWIPNGGTWGIPALVLDSDSLNQEDDQELQIPDGNEENLEIINSLQLIEELPFLITVQVGEKKVHLLHAEFPPFKFLTDEMLEDPAEILELAERNTADGVPHLTWGRYIYGDFHRRPLEQERDRTIRILERKIPPEAVVYFVGDVHHIVSGHTIMCQPFTVLNRTNIDTGAYLGETQSAPKYAGLTCLDLKEWVFYKATPTKFEVSVPFVVNRSDIHTT